MDNEEEDTLCDKFEWISSVSYSGIPYPFPTYFDTGVAINPDFITLNEVDDLCCPPWFSEEGQKQLAEALSESLRNSYRSYYKREEHG